MIRPHRRRALSPHLVEQAKVVPSGNLEVFTDIVQGTEDWFNIRKGIVTASELSVVQAKGRDGGPSIERRRYYLKLAGEIISGLPREESYKSAAMTRGSAMEPEARKMYAFMQDVEPQVVGFIRNGRVGCSPDSLIGSDGGLEIKSAAAHVQIECLMKPDDWFPPEHYDQVMGSIWIAEREWWDLVIYSPGMPMFRRRLIRDQNAINNISIAVDQFYTEMDAIVDKLRGMQ